MINKNMLTSLTLEEIIHLGVHNQLPQLDYSDWVVIETKFRGYMTPEEVKVHIEAELQEAADVNYTQGLEDRGDVKELERLRKILQENGIDY